MADLRTIELLAPAGNASVALSAYDAGADAVYCGLQKFNARERSENFTHEELAKVIAYAHKNRRKLNSEGRIRRKREQGTEFR